MKKIILSATCLLAMSASLVFAGTTGARFLIHSSSSSVCAAPPPAVLASFVSIFGNVPVREWKLRSNSYWRAHFMRNVLPGKQPSPVPVYW